MRIATRVLAVVAAATGLSLAGCGGSGGGASVTAGAGVITITAFAPASIPGGLPTPFTITGTNFETATGTTAQVIFHALGGATPFFGGTSDTATVVGSVDSDTQISGTTPAAVVCGAASISFEVTVVLESGVKSNTFGGGGGLVFTAPTVTGVVPASIPAEILTTIVITGTDFGPIGGPVFVRFVGDGGIALFDDATENETTVVGSITSTTTISVLAPLAAVCGVASRTASIGVTLSNDSCSALLASALTYTAPTIASISTPSVPALDAQVILETITGTGFGPIGATVLVTLTQQAGFTAGMFGDGSSKTAIVPFVIASSTTMTGRLVAATTIAGTNAIAVARADFAAGSCANSPASFITFRAPLLTAITTGQPGNALRETLRTPFTLSGTDHTSYRGVTGGEIMIRFFGGGSLYKPDANGVGTTGADDITGSFIAGMSSPVIQATAAAPISTFVTIFYPDGSFTNDLPVTWAPPPVITSFVNTRAPFQQATPASLNANRCLACVSTPVQINGTSFVAGANVLIHNTANGPVAPIGSGALGSQVIAAAQITGTSPTDATLTAALTQATVRVTNPDGQVGTFTPVFFSTRDVLSNVNASNEPGNTNAEMNIAVNPTNSRNAVVFSHSAGGRMFSAFTTDAGATWTTVLITSAVDGFDVGNPNRFVTDPNVGCDAFGNFYIAYLEGQFAGGPVVGTTWRLVLLQSSTGGATWGNVRVVDSNVVPASQATLDRNEMGVGLARGGGLTDQAVYVAYHDFPNNQIRVNGFRSTGLGNLAAAGFGVATVNNLVAPGGNNYHHPAATVGPHGELSVSFIERNGNTAPTNIWVNTDPDGLGSAVLAFSGQVLVTTSNAPNNRITGPGGYPIPQPNRGYATVPALEYVNAGAFVGRLVLAYDDRFVNDPFPGNEVSFGLRVMTRFSDSLGATWSSPQQAHVLDTRHQWQPWLGSDAATGNLYCTWFDSIADAANNRAVQRFSSVSGQGGNGWVNPLLLSQTASDVNTGTDGNDYLEYEGCAAFNGCVYANWCSFQTGNGEIFASVYQQSP